MNCLKKCKDTERKVTRLNVLLCPNTQHAPFSHQQVLTKLSVERWSSYNSELALIEQGSHVR